MCFQPNDLDCWWLSVWVPPVFTLHQKRSFSCLPVNWLDVRTVIASINSCLYYVNEVNKYIHWKKFNLISHRDNKMLLKRENLMCAASACVLMSEVCLSFNHQNRSKILSSDTYSQVIFSAIQIHTVQRTSVFLPQSLQAKKGGGSGSQLMERQSQSQLRRTTLNAE